MRINEWRNSEGRSTDFGPNWLRFAGLILERVQKSKKKQYKLSAYKYTNASLCFSQASSQVVAGSVRETELNS